VVVVVAKRAQVSRLRRLLTARGRSLEITKAGWLFIGLTLAVGFAAINSGANLLHAIFGAQMALIVASGILSERAVQRVVARRRVAGGLHAGMPCPIVIEIANVAARGDALAVSVEDDDRDPTDARCTPVFAVRVGAGRSLQLAGSVTMPQRGRHALPRAVVATRFPFGLFVKRRELAAPATVTVYPAIRDVATRAMPADTWGDHAPGRGRRARAGDFFGLAEYREGDDLRRVHWPAVARFGRPVVREDEARGSGEIRVALRPGTTGDAAFEREVEHVASQALAELSIGGNVAIDYGGRPLVDGGSGPKQRLRILEALAHVGGST
jgi:uncharacterized protein (DUF58 family)